MTMDTITYLSGPAAVGNGGEPKSNFRSSKGQTIHEFDALHQRVILIGYLILPAAEAPTAVNVRLFQFSEDRLNQAIAAQKRSRVTVVGAIHPNASYVVRRLYEFR